MRLQSNVLTAIDVYQAAALVKDCDVEIERHGSRSHDRSFTLKLSAWGSGLARRRVNSGNYGAGADYSLMWDEWGIVLAELYRRDPDLVCGSVKRPTYADANDYHWQTGGRFLPQPDGSPADITLHTHRWLFVGEAATGSYRMYDCKGTKDRHCPAFIRRQNYSIQSLNGAAS